MTWAELRDLLFKPPPSPPEQLAVVRREAMRDAVRARHAAREYQKVAEERGDILSRLEAIADLINSVGKGKP